ncbi:putative Short-chain dehydrogenase TIC 32, chloroplastic [Glarea lozoyensis 74030]|uniref:Putative Short-chain dehydrogenase TIC 32, chloroplastic n=1 Tax=Glarea lozoyensis (strain ATCC 74030 / MF5533) TaxID=1104152 RepID=H0ER17_GLAL7|nr:putative Short-chain dehydrogenase TIC 32, chloroplastic [Glarea lozoyensis 74030]
MAWSSSLVLVVNVASTGYGVGDVAFDNINFDEGKTYHPWKAYGQSKTANILFTTYLSMHLKSKGIEAFALQPGMPQTNLYKHTIAATDPNDPASFPAAFALIQARYPDGAPSGDLKEDEKTVETASSTPLFAALSPSLDGKEAPESTCFLRNCVEFPVLDYAKNPEDAAKLWVLSEKLVGEKFEI